MYNTNITNKNQGRTEETQATLDTEQRQTKQKHDPEKMNNTDPTKQLGVNSDAREG
jgi:hypothetical protein